MCVCVCVCVCVCLVDKKGSGMWLQPLNSHALYNSWPAKCNFLPRPIQLLLSCTSGAMHTLPLYDLACTCGVLVV